MNEKDMRFDNVIKALYPPFLYFMITLLVEVIADIYLFFKQTKSVTNAGADFLSSYKFLDTLQENMDKYTYLITMIGALVAVLIFGIIYIRECSLEEYTVSKQLKFFENGRNVLLVCLLGFFGSTGFSRFVSLLPLDNVIGNYEATSSTLLKGSLLIQILSLAVFVPAAEELIYRGLVFKRLSKLMNKEMAMLAASVVFGMFHFNLMQGVYAFLLSVLLICAYMKYQSIIPCIIIHSIANLTSVISNYFNISEVFNKNLFVYLFIMTVELIAASIFFFISMRENVHNNGTEEDN